MINTDKRIFLVKFKITAKQNAPIIESTPADLDALAERIRSKKAAGAFAGMDIYEFNDDKLKFNKISLDKFRMFTKYLSTDLQVVLDSIYIK